MLLTSLTSEAQDTGFGVIWDIDQRYDQVWSGDVDEYGGMYTANLVLGERPRSDCASISYIDPSGQHQWDYCGDLGGPYRHHIGYVEAVLAIPGGAAAVGCELEATVCHRVFLAFWDTTGRLVDTFFFDSEVPHAEVRHLVRLDDGYYYALLSHPNHSQLVKMSGTEGLIWAKTLFDERTEERVWVRRMSSVGDTALFFTGLSNDRHIAGDSKTVLAMLDRNGDEIWLHELDLNTNAGAQPRTAALLENEKVLFSVTQGARLQALSTFYMVDAEGTLYEDYISFGFDYVNPIDMIQLANDDILVLAKATSYGSQEPRGWWVLGRFSDDGEAKWIHQLSYALRNDTSSMLLVVDQFADVDELPNGDIVLTGSTGLDALYIRFGADGSCENMNCPFGDYLLTSSTSGQPAPMRSVDIYPQPASTWIALKGEIEDVHRMMIYDMTGRFIKEIRTTGWSTYSIEDVDSGLYHVIYMDASGRSVGSGPLVVHH